MAINREDTLLTPELIDRYTAAGYWGETTLADVFRRNADQRPAKVAYVDDRSSVTWAELWQRSGRVAASLARRGVGRGDVVAVQLPNRVEFVCLLAAVSRLGAVFCQFPPDYRAREVEFILRFSGATTVVVPNEFRGFDHMDMIDGMRDRLPDLINTIVAPVPESLAFTGPYPWPSLEELRSEQSPADMTPGQAVSANDVARIAFTSGTTGDPKAVMHTANTTLFTIQQEIDERGLDCNSTVLVFLPVGMNAGFGGVVEVALAGARGVLMERFNPPGVLDLVERHQVNTFVAAPTALAAILADKTLDGRNLSSLTVIQAGGASSPVELLREANDRLGCPVVDLYGMLETGITSCTSPDEPYEQWVGTVGRPYPWLHVRILAADGEDAPVGVEGDIVKSGPAVTVGYYRNPAKNADSWTADGWFRSGDRGFIDAAGRLTVSGRSKDMIIHGGANIWPREIEEALFTHPDVDEVAVIGIPDDYFGENLCACVVVRGDASLSLGDVINYMKDAVAKYKLPQRLELFDSFPLGPTGKVLKRDLTAAVEARRTKAVGTKSVDGDAQESTS